MNQISQKRKEARVSQRVLAEKLNWRQSRIANYETGIRSPDLASCREIVSALNKFGVVCSIDDVFPPHEQA